VAPTLSILIVNWNTRELLLACLRSITAEAEIVVVDNASADGSADAVAAAFPHVTLIRNERNLGFAAANNQAYRACHGTYVLLLNSDTLVPPGSLERLVAYMEAHPRVGIVGPRLEYGDGSYQISALRFSRPWDVFYEYARFPRRLQPAAQKAPRRLIELAPLEATPVEYVMGAALLIRREVADAVGLMDEAYFMYAEEVDWCYRVHQAGWEVMYLPTAVVTHLGGRSTDQVPDLMLAYRFASTFRFMRLHYGRATTLGARALLALAAAQNSLLALAWRLAGKETPGGLAAELHRNGVVWRTAWAGGVPKGLQPSLDS
jgi:GT2 family glycosyltransferase